MSPLPRARSAPELLDEPGHDPRELAQSLRHVAQVNRWLGGGRALLKHLAPLLQHTRGARILDIGTASADLPRLIVDWTRKRGQRVSIVAADAHAQMLEIARSACALYPEIAVEHADALALPYSAGSFDIGIISLTLHHFDEVQQVLVLKELARVSRQAVIVNELRRTRLNYFGAQLLAATLWRGNRLTRHDGPLSVLRAFTPAELLAVAHAAGIDGRACRHFFQRVVLVGSQPHAG